MADQLPGAMEESLPLQAPDSCDTRPFSTSESLASGLVSRLIREWAYNDQRYRDDRRAATGARGVSGLPHKRAQAYRVLRERSIALVPDGHRLIVSEHGDKRGLDKRAGFSVVHWSVVTALRRMQVVMTYGRPGWRLPLRWLLFTLADHALQRMFFRLKTVNDKDVLAELAHATRTFCAWYPFLITRMEQARSIGLPSPRGMLLLKQVPTSELFSPFEFIATTWVSNELINARKVQMAAIKEARLHGGLVVQVEDDYFPLTFAENCDRISAAPKQRTNVFYAEMIRHLPHPDQTAF